jgi:hypothetical protein
VILTYTGTAKGVQYVHDITFLLFFYNTLFLLIDQCHVMLFLRMC